jgi:hypothetical protein
MKFGFKELFKETPKKLLTLGHALIGITAGITLTDFDSFPKLKIGLQLTGIIGYFLIHMFSKDDKK